MRATAHRSCPLCEATCGVTIERDGDRVVAVRGDEADPFSRGYVCPKGTALGDLHHDPDRLRRPLRRDGDRWIELPWDEALDLVATRLDAVRAAHGRHALGVYVGNPAVHNLGLLTFGQLLLRSLRTRNAFSATSMDQLPHMLAALELFGDQLLMPVPDLDRTDLLICLGANPLASNGSIMTAPDVRGRLAELRRRGGKVIVLDPRRTETAERADRHLPLRPGTDAVLLLAMLNVVFAEGLADLRHLADHALGLAALRTAALPWTPARAATITGVAAEDITRLTRDLATTPRAVLYGRIGVCTQEFGGLAAWLCWAVNAVTGHLDTPGGLMFTTPAVDLLALARHAGVRGGFARWRTRVSDLPEFGGELPVAALVEEIETPGERQLRALLTVAGNPVLSIPGGPRLERALGKLDFMVSIDPYLNETSRHADVILPPTSALERSHYDVALNAFAIRNVAKYAPPTFARPADARHDWEICLGLWQRLGGGGLRKRLTARALGRLGPEAVLDLMLRTGPHGVRGDANLTLAKLRAAPHGIDLGPLESRLPARLGHADRKVHLAPDTYLADLPRLAARFATPPAARPTAELTLIGRRHLRSNNSWLHNSARLVKGPSRCTAMIHPRDAEARGLRDGDLAVVQSRAGAITLPVEITDAIMPGVVSIPHGFGHHRAGARLTVAAAHAGVSVNDLTDPTFVDRLSGTSALTGLPVTLTPVGSTPT
jgi:anaerobic selenocysteine-containing dehydrogenase